MRDFDLVKFLIKYVCIILFFLNGCDENVSDIAKYDQTKRDKPASEDVNISNGLKANLVSKGFHATYYKKFVDEQQVIDTSISEIKYGYAVLSSDKKQVYLRFNWNTFSGKEGEGHFFPFLTRNEPDLGIQATMEPQESGEYLKTSYWQNKQEQEDREKPFLTIMQLHKQKSINDNQALKSYVIIVDTTVDTIIVADNFENGLIEDLGTSDKYGNPVLLKPGSHKIQFTSKASEKTINKKLSNSKQYFMHLDWQKIQNNYGDDWFGGYARIYDDDNGGYKDCYTIECDGKLCYARSIVGDNEKPCIHILRLPYFNGSTEQGDIAEFFTTPRPIEFFIENDTKLIITILNFHHGFIVDQSTGQKFIDNPFVFKPGKYDLLVSQVSQAR